MSINTVRTVSLFGASVSNSGVFACTKTPEQGINAGYAKSVFLQILGSGGGDGLGHLRGGDRGLLRLDE